METFKIHEIVSREEIQKKLQDLIKSNLTREEVTSWAFEKTFEIENLEIDFDDFVLDKTLDLLCLADWIILYPTDYNNDCNYEYNYEIEDFRIWLKEFDDACKLSPLPGQQIEYTQDTNLKPTIELLGMPTPREASEKLKALAEGSLTSSQASKWAMPWVIKAEEGIIIIEDKIFHQTLINLYQSGLPSRTRKSLYNQADYIRWAQEAKDAYNKKYKL